MAIGKASIMQKWMTLTLTILHVVVGDVGTNCSRPAQIRLALLQPFRGDKGFEQTAAAATMAIADAHSQGLLNGTEVSVVYRDDQCNGKTALGVISELLNKVQAFFGMPCTAAAIDGGKLISYWNISWFSYYAPDGVFADEETYQTLVRIMSNNVRMATSLVKFFNYHKWSNAGLVYTITGECEYTIATIKDVFNTCSVRVTVESKPDDSGVSDAIVTGWLKSIKTKARVVVLCGESSFIRQFILAAHRMGMANEDYVYITINQMPPYNLRTFWSSNDSSDAEARIAFASVYQLAAHVVKDEDRANQFLAQIPLKMAEPPWNFNGTIDHGLTGSRYALLLYDAVSLYMQLTEILFESGICDYNNSANYQELGKLFSFEGLTGTVVLDFNTDRIMDYNVWYLPDGKDTYELHMTVPMTKAAANASECTEWLFPVIVSDFPMPTDTPSCGFFNEFCPIKKQAPEYLWSVLSAVVLLFASALSVGCYFSRRKIFQEQVAMMKWKIKYSDIVFDNHVSLISVNKADTSDTEGRDHNAASTNNYTIGSYNHHTVAIKLLQCETVTLSAQELLELKTMRDLNHENLNTFVGLCNEPGRVCILTTYCYRGSLKDILADEHIKLDNNFKISFIGDIIKGMDYLHRSPLKYHGRFKTSNVLVDSRWTVRITDWGIVRLRTTQTNAENDMDYMVMLFTAPEILRKSQMSTHSFQKSDVYSFAIVAQEILFRAGPFPLVDGVEITFKDIVNGVKNGKVPPVRPYLPPTRNFDAKLIETICECWSEDPGLRPNFSTIKSRYFGLFKGHLNLMDNMLKMMEKYAGSLEEQVQERTKQLEEEKRKTDMLLYSMLPQYVADKLKSGSNVIPEVFPEVSIYFSDIVSFTTLAAESSPMQVVSLLNDLYTTFDEVLSMYNVYKVETIGDAYMVASGVPVANPRHASEIASMSLSIRERVRSFKIRHRPNQSLEIRIGINSGPVVAGIVGLKMPRYCLFGDTVNTASRMESSGKAMHIQLSRAAFEALQESGCSFITTKRGHIEVKGKGMQTTYWLEGKLDPQSDVIKSESSLQRQDPPPDSQ